MRITTSALLLLTPLVLSAQQAERVTLDGPEVAIYNLVGRLQVVGGGGNSVIVEVTRGGRDGGRLKLLTDRIRGRAALRIDYPDDRIVYSDLKWNGRSNFTISDDGTWGESGNGRYRRRVEVSSRGSGLEAHADLRVTVPKGKKLFLRQGIGETTIENVEGELDVDVSASRVRVAHIKGTLNIETGSGGVEVIDMSGDLNLDSGSGGAVLEGVRGGALKLDVGSGSLRGRDIDVTEIVADIGSGGVRLSGVKAPRVRVETGSGSSEIELLAPIDDVDIETGSGGVTLRLPAATNATVDIETGSGGIDTDFEVRMTRIERRALRGTIGTGKGRIRIESGSGSVRLLKSQRSVVQ